MINALWSRQLLSSGCRTLEAEWLVKVPGVHLPAACPAELGLFRTSGLHGILAWSSAGWRERREILTLGS